MVGSFLCGGADYMAFQTCAVVRGAFCFELLVRIVACDTGQARVALAPTFALFQAVGLRPRSGWARPAGELHIPKRGVACTAKIHGVRGPELRRVENCGGAGFSDTAQLRGL